MKTAPKMSPAQRAWVLATRKKIATLLLAEAKTAPEGIPIIPSTMDNLLILAVLLGLKAGITRPMLSSVFRKYATQVDAGDFADETLH